MERIKQWYQQNPNARVFVTSFVRKLVADLQNDIDTDTDLSTEQKRNITVSTLHKFARRIVERNHGTSEWRFQRFFRIIGQFWKEVVWEDVLAFYPLLDKNEYLWKKSEEQLHNSIFEQSEEWRNLKRVYFKLCKYFNATGFADLITRAIDALIENPDLRESDHFIVDEYQDFNSAEDTLINLLVGEPNGMLVVGDDEQVLYDKLKSGKPTLIRTRYRDVNFAKAMLPFCGRSSFHITKTAGHFIQQNRVAECIEKIYLPIKTADIHPKVQVIACARAQTAVDYIEKFVNENKTAIDERKNSLEAGQEKDAFLLILTPAKEVNFYSKAKETVVRIVAEYQTDNRKFSEDYYKILSYCSLVNNPQNNFTFRKVLYYEEIPEAKVHELIVRAMRNGQNLCDLDAEEIQYAMQKCNEIKIILDNEDGRIEKKIDEIARHITINDKDKLKKDIARKSINNEEIARLEHEEEEEAELEEIEVKKMSAVELMTIVGSKGLSADHVIIIGFENVNMNYVTINAFYVAMTRARQTLHILTALRSGGAREAHAFLEQLPDDHIEYYSYTKSNHTKTRYRNKSEFKNYMIRLNNFARRN